MAPVLGCSSIRPTWAEISRRTFVDAIFLSVVLLLGEAMHAKIEHGRTNRKEARREPAPVGRKVTQ